MLEAMEPDGLISKIMMNIVYSSSSHVIKQIFKKIQIRQFLSVKKDCCTSKFLLIVKRQKTFFMLDTQSRLTAVRRKGAAGLDKRR